MDVGVGWDRVAELLPWMVDRLWVALVGLWQALVDLQARYPQILSFQSLFGLASAAIAVWKWWEAREINLFRRFERMIERQEAQLVKARTDLLEVLLRPGPGISIKPPLFAERMLRLVLLRRRWVRPLWSRKSAEAIDAQLDSAIATCNRKVGAHIRRLSFFRIETASALLVQGALASARAGHATNLAEQQRLDQAALNYFRAVLAIPEHRDNLEARELVGQQLARLGGQSKLAADTISGIVDELDGQAPSPARNLRLARAKRSLAVLLYVTAPKKAQELLSEAAELITEFGPPRDRDHLELAQVDHLHGIARLRLNAPNLGSQLLSDAISYYNDLLGSLEARRPGLFRWMFLERRFSGHRIAELEQQARAGLAHAKLVLSIHQRRQRLLYLSLARGNGVPRRNRKP